MSARDAGWRRLASRYLFQSRWYSLREDQVQLPGGQQLSYTLIDHPGYTLVVPLLDDGRVVMERIYRYPLDAWLLECPSGGLDGEAPDVAARRELMEETGYHAGRLEALGSFWSSTGNGNECCHAFLATELVAAGRPALEVTEQFDIELIPLAALETQALAGTLTAVTSAHAILLAAARLRGRAPRP